MEGGPARLDRGTRLSDASDPERRADLRVQASLEEWLANRSPLARQARRRFGGPEGIRTPDLLNAIQARSQLRHWPTRPGREHRIVTAAGGAVNARVRTPDGNEHRSAAQRDAPDVSNGALGERALPCASDQPSVLLPGVRRACRLVGPPQPFRQQLGCLVRRRPVEGHHRRRNPRCPDDVGAPAIARDPGHLDSKRTAFDSLAQVVHDAIRCV